MKYLVIFCAAFLLPTTGRSQEKAEKRISELNRIAGACGYLFAQEESIKYIEEKFPDLKSNAFLANLEFNSTFKAGKFRIDSLITVKVGENNIKSFRDSIFEKLRPFIMPTSLTQEQAQSFLDEVRQRATGDIKTPVLQTLLHWTYINNPAKEFGDGFRQKFSTKGHPKAKGTKWQIEVPLSWRAQEEDRPNIVQRFTSNYGQGFESVAILNKKLSGQLSQRELSQMYSESGIKGLLPQGAQLMTSSRRKIDNIDGVKFDYKLGMERAGFKVDMIVRTFLFIRGRNLYQAQCILTSLSNEDLSYRLKKFNLLFDMMENSIVVMDQYE